MHTNIPCEYIIKYINIYVFVSNINRSLNQNKFIFFLEYNRDVIHWKQVLKNDNKRKTNKIPVFKWKIMSFVGLNVILKVYFCNF